MVTGVIDNAGGGKNQPSCTPVRTAGGADIAFVISIPAGEQTFTIIKTVTADVHVAGDVLITAILTIAGIFCNIITRQPTVSINI